MSRQRLGVIFGGRSVEHEVSVVSAMSVLEQADRKRFEVVPFGVTRDGRWLMPDEAQRQLDRDDPPFRKRIESDLPPLSQRPEVLGELARCDAVFPLVHGVNGEDGTLQGMLEMLALPYVGCGVAASALGMDKSLQKLLFKQAGLDVAPFITVSVAQWEQEREMIAADATQSLGYPVFVKPANGGSSVGVSKVFSREDLADAMQAAFALDGKALIESAVKGRELECGVLGNSDPQASPIGEVTPAGEFYDYNAKYIEETARLTAPADLDDETAEELQDLAIEAFQAIDGEGFARVDFFLPKDEEPVINEINTIPGFTPISMFPRLWALAGVSYSDLISRLVDLAIERFQRREGYGA
jgi:D-alanine-D-alanine ligase